MTHRKRTSRAIDALASLGFALVVAAFILNQFRGHDPPVHAALVNFVLIWLLAPAFLRRRFSSMTTALLKVAKAIGNLADAIKAIRSSLVSDAPQDSPNGSRPRKKLDPRK